MAKEGVLVSLVWDIVYRFNDCDAIILIRIANRELNVKLNCWEYPEDTDTCSTNLSYQVLSRFVVFLALMCNIT